MAQGSITLGGCGPGPRRAGRSRGDVRRVEPLDRVPDQPVEGNRGCSDGRHRSGAVTRRRNATSSLAQVRDVEAAHIGMTLLHIDGGGPAGTATKPHLGAARNLGEDVAGLDRPLVLRVPSRGRLLPPGASPQASACCARPGCSTHASPSRATILPTGAASAARAAPEESAARAQIATAAKTTDRDRECKAMVRLLSCSCCCFCSIVQVQREVPAHDLTGVAIDVRV